MLKSYKYRIFPTEIQSEHMSNVFGQVRFVYNLGIETKIAAHTQYRKNINCFELIKQMVDLKNNEAPWLKESPSQALQMSLRNLDNAYTNFFRGKGFPKFKSKYSKQSYQLPQGVKVDFKKNIIFIPKAGKVSIDFSKTFKGKIKTTTISRTVTNKYFVSILVDNNKENPKPKPMDFKNSVGIDLGIKDLVITSDRKVFKNHKYFVSTQKKLKLEQRSLARKAKGSKSRERQKIKVALCYEKVTNQRKDYLHKITTELVDKYQTIVIEDLAVSNMIKNRKLSKHIADASWGEFRSMLEYKAVWKGKNVKVIGRFCPSSKLCRKCGNIKKDLKLSDRTYNCDKCGHSEDRDINAAINIKNFGFRAEPISRQRKSLGYA